MSLRTLSQVLKYSILQLNSSPSPQLDCRIIIDFLLQKNSLFLSPETLISEEIYSKILTLIERRKKLEPIAYIIGKKEFYGLEFKVTQDTLIPRPDSEIIIETALEILKEHFDGKSVKIMDLCTGSGALAVTILKNFYSSKVEIFGVDISEKAIEIATFNGKNILPNASNLNFFIADLLDENFEINADVVISNPPYIPSKTIEILGENVKNFEPRLALDGGEDGLIFYRKIAKKALKSKFIILEIGQGQSPEIIDIFHNLGYKFLKGENDLSGIERCLIFST